MSLVFSIYGFGEVGSLVAALINTSFQGVTIHVLNTQEKKNGRILDLEHAAAVRGNSIVHNRPSLLPLSDFVVFAAGYSNVHGESRNSVANKNRILVNELFREIEFTSRTTFIVITNPVEPMSYWIRKVVGEQCRVIGTGTALDTFRLKHLIAEQLKCTTHEVETLVVGEHGTNMVPLYSLTTVHGVPIRNILPSADLNKLTIRLKNSAFEIRETEKATKYGVAETTLFMIRNLLSESGEMIPCSIEAQVAMSGNSHSDNDLFVSWPIHLSVNGIQGVSLELDILERSQFQDALKMLREFCGSINQE